MISKPFALGLLAFACVSAAAGGAYVAVRHNEAPAQVSAPVEAGAPASEQARPVAETEAVVAPPAPVEVEAPPVTTARKSTTEKRTMPPPARAESPRADSRGTTTRTPSTVADRAPQPTTDHGARTTDPPSASSSSSIERPSTSIERPSTPRDANATSGSSIPAAPPLPEVTPSEPPPAARPQFVEVVVPASSVVGLKVETSLSSETARVEDRVEGRVTRDVMADGRLAIPAGTRVLGDVTTVERGGKMKDKARLGVRFHTLVLADGTQVPFRTDAIVREGSSPGSESARKIGGAAIGGAIIGAIMGGAKGAAIGGATGAGAGSAVVMAGDRNAATLPAGTVVTVRLNSPVTVDVEKEL